jgi:hypothetical protein
VFADQVYAAGRNKDRRLSLETGKVHCAKNCGIMHVGSPSNGFNLNNHGPRKGLARRQQERPRAGLRQRIHWSRGWFQRETGLLGSWAVRPAAVAFPDSQVWRSRGIEADLDAHAGLWPLQHAPILNRRERAGKELVADA